jgi:RHS repeat-associated protein
VASSWRGKAERPAAAADAVNGLNQYSAAGPASFTYDANGNLTGDGTWTYTYDAENRLIKAVSGATTVNLTYDPAGRLFQTDKGTSGTTTKFLYDGDALVAEYNSNNSMTARYVHGSNSAADDPLVWYANSGLTGKKWLHADHLGSIIALTTSAGGTGSINAYDEYGIPGANNSGRFQYTGQAWIGELGMYYYKARFYSPNLGRFLQTDPIGYDGGVNLYSYVGDDPVDRTDPSGEDPVSGADKLEKQRAELINTFARSQNATVRINITKDVTLTLTKKGEDVTGTFQKKGVPGSVRFTGKLQDVKGKSEYRVVGLHWSARAFGFIPVGKVTSSPQYVRIYSNSHGLFSQMDRRLTIHSTFGKIADESTSPQRLNREAE